MNRTVLGALEFSSNSSPARLLNSAIPLMRPFPRTQLNVIFVTFKLTKLLFMLCCVTAEASLDYLVVVLNYIDCSVLLLY